MINMFKEVAIAIKNVKYICALKDTKLHRIKWLVDCVWGWLSPRSGGQQTGSGWSPLYRCAWPW